MKAFYYLNNMKTKLLAIVLTTTLALSACISDGTTSPIGVPVQEQVFVLPEDVQEDVYMYPQVNPVTGYPDAALLDVSELDGVMGDIIDAYFRVDVDKIVLTEAAYVKADVMPSEVFRPVPQTIDEETGEAELDTLTATTQAATGIMGAIPGLAPYAPLAIYLLGLLGKRRPRKHIGNLTKALIPYDGKVDIAQALMSAQKAIGWEHSTEGSDKDAKNE